jgi:HK97 family phage portal protein
MLLRLKHFFAPERKRSGVAPVIALHTQGRPQWTPRNFASLAREGYAGNAIGYRAARMIAEAAASVPWLLYEGRAERDSHPLLGLLRQPSPAQSGRQLLESLYGFLQVSGNAYLERVDLDGSPRELHVLRPDRVKIVPGADGWPESFEYAANGTSIRLPAAAILHLKLFHPLNDHYGLSPLEPAARSIDTHNAANAWNKAMLDNAARPSGALIFRSPDSGNNLTTEQFDRLKEELERSYQGALNAGRPMVLEGGLDWKEMGYSPEAMQFIEAKNLAAREIALAFGVPPMLLGIPGDNTYANYAEANRSFWRQTVLPLVARTAEALTNFLGPAYGEGLRLGFDTDQIEALSAEREALWRRIAAADYLTTDEKRAAVGYGKAG